MGKRKATAQPDGETTAQPDGEATAHHTEEGYLTIWCIRGQAPVAVPRTGHAELSTVDTEFKVRETCIFCNSCHQATNSEVPRSPDDKWTCCAAFDHQANIKAAVRYSLQAFQIGDPTRAEDVHSKSDGQPYLRTIRPGDTVLVDAGFTEEGIKNAPFIALVRQARLRCLFRTSEFVRTVHLSNNTCFERYRCSHGHLGVYGRMWTGVSQYGGCAESQGVMDVSAGRGCRSGCEAS